MARFADALVTDADLVRAAHEAAAAALGRLDGPANLVFVFVAGDDPDAVESAARVVRELCPDATVLGCSAGGVLGGGQAAEGTSGVSILAGSVRDLRVRAFHLEVIRTPEGMAVVGMPTQRADDQAMVLFADPFSFPVDGFVERSNATLPGLPMVGGLATGPHGPGSTRLFVDGHVHDRGAVGLLLGGKVTARALVSQGCRPVGPTMVVTRSEDNVVLELAGVPALQKLERVLTDLPPLEQALASSGLQFGIAMDEYAEEHERGDFLIRAVLGVDNARQGIVVGDMVPVGRTVRFQVRDAETADEDLERTLAAAAGDRASVDGALLVSCNGRGAHLFADAGHDVAAVRERLGAHGVAGFFAGGEIGPVAGRNYLHGFTASLLTFAR